MKITVPRYIKLILMYCGFDDCHAIAAIEKAHLNRFINEVRLGNVTNLYEELRVNDALDGSRESEENFVFILGHERLLMAVVNFVKQNLSDISIYQKRSFENSTPKITNEPSKEIKLSKDLCTSKLLEHVDQLPYDVSRNDVNFHSKIESIHAVHEIIIKHQYTLLTMVVTSLKAQTSKMYQEVSARLARDSYIRYILRL